MPLQAHAQAIDTTLIQAEEDAAYLRVVELLKEGRNVEARTAAGNYLELFPDGFRRREVRAVAESLTHPHPL